MNVILQENGPFRVELDYEQDTDYDFSHYGRFCELPSRDQEQAQAHNDPKTGKFHIRNPNAWRKSTSAVLGTPSWQRTDLSIYGWFRLAEHPIHEVEALMKEEKLSERDAWRQVLDRWETLVEQLVNNDLIAMWLKVEVYWHDELVGEEAIGGIEAMDHFTEEEAIESAKEHGLIDLALAMAKKEINKMYGVAPTAPNNEAHTAPDNAAMSGKE